MRERPRFDENQIADRNECNARAGRGKIPACALVVLHCNMRRQHAARTISAKKFLPGQEQEEITEAGG
jgi:hypothetical protein